MTSWLEQLCGTGFMPHGQCYLWTPQLLWLHGVSDSLIALAYFSIPLALVSFVRRRSDLPYPRIFLMFGAFIVACGLTHALEVWTIWHSHYYLTGLVKAGTAALSLATAVALFRIVPEALQLAGPDELRRLNASLEQRVHERTAALETEITERKRAEAEVQHLNRQLQQRVGELQALFDVLPVGVAVADEPSCHRIRINGTLARLLRMDPGGNASFSAPEGESPRHFHILLDGQRADPDALLMQICCRENRPVVGQNLTIVHTDGTRVEFIGNAAPLRDPDGRVTGCVATFQDVTALQQALASNTHFAAIIANADDAIVGKTLAGVITDWNGGAEKLLGYTAAEAIGQPIHLIVPPDRLDEEKDILTRLTHGESIPLFETVRRHKDGRAIEVSLQISPIRDASGRIVGASSSARDITRRMLAERELRRSESRLASLVAAALDGIITIDEHGTIVDWNPAAEQLLGHRRDDAIGRELSSLIVPPNLREAHRRGLARVVASGESQMLGRRIEMPALHASGRELTVELAITRIQRHPPLFTAFLRDLTERKLAERRQHELDHKLLEAQKLESLGILAGGIAHDFNNLLTGVLGNASLARSELPPGNTVEPLLAQIETSSRRAADLCRQLLAYAGRGRFVVQNLNLNPLISETIQLLKLSIGKTCALRLNLATELPAISADATQLRQVVMNLVINASEAIGERSGVIALTTGVVGIDDDYRRTLLQPDIPCGDYVFLEIGDDGCGMDRATLGRIFDPFYTTKFTGRGLGLAAVLGIVRGHQGAIKVYSEPGGGSTFRLFFPAIGQPADPLRPLSTDATEWRGGGTVLVVDDEEAVRIVAARCLKTRGFSVELAVDGREAVEKFRADPARYRLVLLDLTMPHLDGEETYRQLRHIQPGVRVVLMSGFNEQEALGRFVGKGLAGFVQKPFAVDTLLAAVRSALLAS